MTSYNDDGIMPGVVKDHLWSIIESKSKSGSLDLGAHGSQSLKMRLDDFLLLVREWIDSNYILLLFETNKCNILLISCAQVGINSQWEHKRDNTLVFLSLSQEAWSGLSSCCSHSWRYGGPDCPPVVDLFLSTGIWSFLDEDTWPNGSHLGLTSLIRGSWPCSNG